MSGFPRPVLTFSQPVSLNGGTNTSGIVQTWPGAGPASGVATQSPTTVNDVYPYLSIGGVSVAGVAIVAICATAGGSFQSLYLFSTVVGTPDLIQFVLPAGWWYKVTWTGTIVLSLLFQSV